MCWIIFLAGMFVGGAAGVFVMCLCVTAAGDRSRERGGQEQRP